MTTIPVITIDAAAYADVKELVMFIKDTVFKSDVPTVFRLPYTMRVAAMIYPDHSAYLALNAEEWKPFDLRGCALALLLIGT